MKNCSCFLSSSIGKKIVVAVTGLLMLGFVVGHMLGNLQVFLGPEKINDYAEFLHETKGLLWGTRVVLLFSVVLHFIFTVQLTRLNKNSRPEKYENHTMVQANAPSRFMIWSGLFLAFYVVFHLLHLTVGSVHPAFISGDVYNNIVVGFSSKLVSFVYLLAMISLGMHLYHGVYSVFQTLGLNHPKINFFRQYLALFIAIAIPLGYSAIPLAVLMGILK
ncbi:MAG: succinate dehydrogenase cytochrome b subunit [Elusimicrobiota bacterium]